MSKIRINELARELEVKPNKILDALPELGVVDKKTHSSSLDDDVADLVRRHFGVEVVTRPAPEAEPDTPSPAPQPGAETKPGRTHAAGSTASAAVEEVAEEFPHAAETPSKATPTLTPAAVELPPRRHAPQPLRPPLATGRPVSAEAPPAPVAPAAAAPPVPVAEAPAVVTPAKGVSIPVKPLPAPKPGQILTGPRQPFPAAGGEARGAAPAA
ncbi:MAG: translation initiation factor IF-2 N-terminal domain-containing protein, partial [Acidobacteria bacterium]|nr:translation initiation factor IF-2 N-terminal domain-containing protein [Acidobacteriota bacterium]